MSINFEHVCTFFRQQGIELSLRDIEVMKAHTRISVIPAHTMIMQQGKRVQKLYFLNSGIVRLFRVHEGRDYTLGLISTRDFVSTLLYLQHPVPSSCALETLTETEALEWDLAAIQAIKQQVPRAYELELTLMDRLLTWLQDAQIDAMYLTAEERYHKMVRQQPELLQKIPLKYIAAWLNIHQDSLSRIRKAAGQKLPD